MSLSCWWIVAWWCLCGVATGADDDRSLYRDGESVYLSIFFSELDQYVFEDMTSLLQQNLEQNALGIQHGVQIRTLDYSVGQVDVGYNASLVFDFAADDAVPAHVIVSKLEKDPDAIFPQEQFGAYTVYYAKMLSCAYSCGMHGMKSPKIDPKGGVSCTCQCDAGWMTDLEQPFESFEYCGVQTEMNRTDTPAPSQSAANWRPPIYPSPPPPPKTYKDESGTSLPLFKWAIIGASIVVGAIVVFILCKTRCCGACRGRSCCCCCCTPSPSPARFPNYGVQLTLLLLLNISLLLMSTPINTNPLHSDTKPYHIVLLPKGIPRKTSPSIIMCVNK
eukprot:jgi/Picre1/33156/NNA_008481.t1